MTINEGIAFLAQLTKRISDLEGIRSQCVNKVTNHYGENTTVTEPQYDVRKIDAKISAMQLDKYKLDAAIKKANAVTQLDNINLNVDAIFSPLE